MYDLPRKLGSEVWKILVVFGSVYALWTLNIPWQWVPQFSYVLGGKYLYFVAIKLMLADTCIEFLNHLFWNVNCFSIHHISPACVSRNLILIVSLLLPLLQSEESYNGASLYLHFILNLLCDISISLFFLGVIIITMQHFRWDHYVCI